MEWLNMEWPNMDQLVSLFGAFCFGTLIGWYVYYINRYRKGDVQLGDLTTILGVLGGGTITKLFDEGSSLFGAYGIGLAVGFFGYFLSLIYLVKKSPNFDFDWFLDGRRKRPTGDYEIPQANQQAHQTAMGAQGRSGVTS